MAKSMPTTITRTDLPPFASRMRQAADPVWEEGYRQPFIQELGAGTLDRSKFAFYLMQDELYLGAYAKVHALAVTKTDDREVMAWMASVQDAILHVETSLHRDYLASFGLTEEKVLHGQQSAFARAYDEHAHHRVFGRSARHPGVRAALRVGVRRLWRATGT